MNNPMQIISAMLQGKNPQEFVMQLATNNTNPLLANLIEMAQKGDKQGVENFARNFFKERGEDFDSIMKKFK